MPPQLALVLALIFISFIIYKEHQRSQLRGWGVWILAFFLLHASSKGLGTFLNIETTIEEGSLPDRYFLLTLGIISIILIIKNRFSINAALRQNWIYVTILTYMLLSVTWSRFPGISLRRWGREAIVLIIACLLISEKNPILILYSSIKKVIYVALPISIILIKYYPLYGRQYGRWTGEVSWVGISSQKNGLAMLCAISIIFLVWFIWQDISSWHSLSSKLPPLIDTFMLLIAFYLFLGPQRSMTYSATSFASLLTALICMITLKLTNHPRKNIKKIVVVLSIIIIIIGIVMPFSGKIPIKKLPKMLNRTETLTDRTEIWNILLPYAKRNILLGYGFGGFWTTSLREAIASHAHNGYLETILNLGFMGLIIFSSFLISTIFKLGLLISDEREYFIPFLAIAIMFLVQNISEALLGDFQSFMSALIVLVSFIATKELSSIKLEPEKMEIN